MNKYEILILLILLIILLKSITPFIEKIRGFKNEQLKFTMRIKVENINRLTGLEFEGFCQWLFQNNPEYKYVELTPYGNDGGVDLILTNADDEKIYVECKRYDTHFNLDNETDAKERGELFIGRVACQKLVGAMMANNIKKGIILTTGSVSPNALEYIGKLEDNSDLSLEIYTMDNILKLIGAHENQDDYEFAVEI
ncbi:restriction endonuclease [Clostridium sp.]|uniref:restriction endonuclease n=1 Tax=Clostridium sp. TaxID=1506 RepID=UPI00321667EF